MRRIQAKANVSAIRQRTQFSCVATSTCMALNAVGVKCTEDEVNEVIGAKPMQGARWEEVLACAQYFGCRATLTTPATLTQVKEWTDAGFPVLIAWNPEGREWSHASLIFDVTGEKGNYVVHVADPNIPNPDKTTREVNEDDFYSKWFEKWPNYLVRRPALKIEREVSPDGRQIMASRIASTHLNREGLMEIEVNQIHIYDFDATLFRSPKAPAWYDNDRDGEWHQNPLSLGEICLPKGEQWVKSVVEEARKSIASKDVYAVVCTGRRKHLQKVVEGLLRKKGLKFDDVILKDMGGTESFKKRVIDDLMSKFPNAIVHMWEDRHHHLSSFMQHIEMNGGVGIPHAVPDNYSTAECSEEEFRSMNRSAKVKT